MADLVGCVPGGQKEVAGVRPEVGAAVDVPVGACRISGEYAMIETAAGKGWIDRDKAILEPLAGSRRAGAQMVLTCGAAEVAQRFSGRDRGRRRLRR
ncbi:hypothetical protein EAO77_34825 [Streptomyces sp. t39]|nr:hypothetical protein EAO77_34825 [Streptomyces sp. t39]